MSVHLARKFVTALIFTSQWPQAHRYRANPANPFGSTFTWCIAPRQIGHLNRPLSTFMMPAGTHVTCPFLSKRVCVWLRR
jgi:hypothetical protein